MNKSEITVETMGLSVSIVGTVRKTADTYAQIMFANLDDPEKAIVLGKTLFDYAFRTDSGSEHLSTVGAKDVINIATSDELKTMLDEAKKEATEATGNDRGESAVVTATIEIFVKQITDEKIDIALALLNIAS